MSYNYLTWSALQAQLSLRLYDTAQVFWVIPEIQLILKEALRTFGLASSFWRDRGNLTSSTNTTFYDLPSTLKNGTSELILGYTVTDQDIIQQLQFALLESAASQTSWSGTQMFTYQDLVNATQNRLNQFLSDTGCVVNRVLNPVASPPIGRQALDQSIIDVRRVAWVGAAPEAYYTTLWREDERMLTAADQSWSVTPGQPEAYSVMAPPPLQLQLAPIPQTSGQLEMLVVQSTTLDPANTPTVLGITDDLTPAIKWGALADLLGKDGIARDPVRAAYCEKRYQQYVMLARTLPVVLHAELNGVPLIPCTLQEEDADNPNWQNIAANVSNPVQDVILAAPNLVALSAIPDGAYSMTFDVVRKTPIPVNPTDFVQLGREQIDMLIDYAEHLALFKVGGAEWHATERQAQNFLMQSITYNQRLSADARAVFSAADQSQRQKQALPRRVQAWLNKTFGVGALKDGGEGGGGGNA